ncbi:MAG: hypothetical protein HY678_02285, partial [Chloroflexi bacterium]|nr:hypothetical protein [Chloroflexota bacterium]
MTPTVAALFPILRGLILAGLGLGIGAGLAVLFTNLTGRPSIKEPVIALGYVLALIGWLMGVGMWDAWAKEWFGASKRQPSPGLRPPSPLRGEGISAHGVGGVGRFFR